MENKKKILTWAEEDRPREKLMLKGKNALSDAELIAILIGSGTVSSSAVDLAREILNTCNNNLHELALKNVTDLKKIKGIGEAKAITIMSAMELGRRRKLAETPRQLKIQDSNSAYQAIYSELLDLQHEEFWILILNRANIVIKKEQISIGGIAGTVADPKIIFKKALENLASGIILVHNHPSGNKNPSEEDIKLTNRVKEAGKILDLPVLDHIIFTNNGYYSFADDGRYF